jgi:hypothetical protein
MRRARADIILQPLHGSERGFAFRTETPTAAFVLDEWSFTILQALSTLQEDQVLDALSSAAFGLDTRLIKEQFLSTVEHLQGLGLLEIEDARHS